MKIVITTEKNSEIANLLAQKIIAKKLGACVQCISNIQSTYFWQKEIVSENEFFDYQAKYKGKSKEITPARINSVITRKIQNTTIDIYRKINLRGMCRIDYIIMNDIPYIIEINTIPGLSEESIIPQQLKSAKLKMEKIFEICLLNTK